MDKQNWYIHTTEYYSAMKRNNLLIHKPSGWLSRELCWMKRSQFQMYDSIYTTVYTSHLYHFLGMIDLMENRLPEVEEKVEVGGKWVCLWRATQRTPVVTELFCVFTVAMWISWPILYHRFTDATSGEVG